MQSRALSAEEPGDLSNQWQRLQSDLKALGQVHHQVRSKIVMPRFIEIGNRLQALRERYPRRRRDLQGQFEKHAEQWLGLKRASVYNFMGLAADHQLLTAYTQRHNIETISSLREALALLRAARAEQRQGGPQRPRPAASRATTAGMAQTIQSLRRQQPVLERLGEIAVATGRPELREEIAAIKRDLARVLDQLEDLARNPSTGGGHSG